MRLTCSRCQHHWEETVADDRAVVSCPQCATAFRLPARPPTPERWASSPAESDAVTMLVASAPQPGPPARQPVTSASDAAARGLRKTKLTTAGLDKTVLAGMSAAVAPGPSRVPARSGAAELENAEALAMIGRTLGGYRIVKLLGAGGMGAVFLARQLSLDRDVALKIVSPEYANDPVLLARFTREALGAAQLNHHNIIQVYDVGAAGDTQYISMEYVRGESIGAMIRRDGRFKADDAAGYGLQAARGLLYAHERGIVHRDIKPDNLMINEHGFVKIADMGLVKLRGDVAGEPAPQAAGAESLAAHATGELTMARAAMGTPTYMAPEQARDASQVDARADQYSLGCTLYFMCAGKAPFSGSSAEEIINQHLKSPMPPLESQAPNVPPTFSRIVERMVEKDPDRRYASLAETIRELEAWLGLESEKGPYTPREQHLAVLDAAQKSFYSAPSLRKRKLTVAAFFAAMPALMLLAALGGELPLAGGFLGLLALTPLANFIADGLLTKNELFRRARSVFFAMPWKSWVATVGMSALALALLYLLGWLWYWLAFAVLAAGLAATYQWLAAKPLRAERKPALDRMQAMLRELRVRGVSEEALCDFVHRFTGAHWEEFFECLFGYEAMIRARGKRAAVDKTAPRRRFGVWRDPLARLLDDVERARRAARERTQLVRVEKRRLAAGGVGEKEAERQAQRVAQQVLAQRTLPAAPKTAARTASKSASPRATRVAEAAEPQPQIGEDLRARKRFGWFTIARGALGAAIVIAWFVHYRFGSSPEWLPAPLAALLHRYYDWGAGDNPAGLFAGTALLLSVFSERVFAAAMMTAGAVLMVAAFPLISLIDQPQFNALTAFYCALALSGGGIGYCLLSKLAGGRF